MGSRVCPDPAARCPRPPLGRTLQGISRRSAQPCPVRPRPPGRVGQHHGAGRQPGRPAIWPRPARAAPRPVPRLGRRGGLRALKQPGGAGLRVVVRVRVRVGYGVRPYVHTRQARYAARVQQPPRACRAGGPRGRGWAGGAQVCGPAAQAHRGGLWEQHTGHR